MSIRKPYQERSDLEKVQSQWGKFTALHTRKEWSAAIVRAATAAEIAANYAIRREFAAQSEFDAGFVNSLMLWANGLSGKMDRLLIPLSHGSKKSKFRNLRDVAGKINNKRNAIVHQGEFCNEGEAKEIIGQARIFIETLIGMYDPEFKLRDKVSKKR